MEQRLGEEGQGFVNFMKTLDAGRIGVAALSLGLAQGAFDVAVRYANRREQFGQKIWDFQQIQFRLADMATEIEAGRHLTYHAAWLKDRGEPFSKQAAMAKLFCSELAMRATLDAIQVLGGAGYTSEYPVERMMRDAKVCEIGEGTNEIQKMVIGRHVLDGGAWPSRHAVQRPVGARAGGGHQYLEAGPPRSGGVGAGSTLPGVAAATLPECASLARSPDSATSPTGRRAGGNRDAPGARCRECGPGTPENEDLRREILVSATPQESWVALLEDKQLVEIMFDRPDQDRIVGDIFLGRVEAVLPGIQAAFVDIGTEKAGFLHVSDLNVDDDDLDDDDDNGKRQRQRRTGGRGRRRQRSSRPSRSTCRRASRSWSRRRRSPSAPRVPASPRRSRCRAASSCTCRTRPTWA